MPPLGEPTMRFEMICEKNTQLELLKSYRVVKKSSHSILIKRYKNLEGSDFSGTRKEVNNTITILEGYKMLRLEKSRRRFQQQISDANSELPPYPRRVIEKMYIVENALHKTLKPINLF